MAKRGANIKAVVFDVGGVLQLGGKKKRLSPKDVHISGIHEYVSKKLNLTIDQYFDAIDSAYAKSMEGQISKSVLLGIFSCNLNYPKDKLEKLYHKAYSARFKKNKWLYKVVSQLKEQGYKVAVLSDQWHLSSDVLIPKKDQKLFDEVVISCDVGMRKPHKEIYEYTLKKLKVKPEETVFVDNQEWNLIAAHKIGMKTMLFVDNKKAKEQFKDFCINVR